MLCGYLSLLIIPSSGSFESLKSKSHWFCFFLKRNSELKEPPVLVIGWCVSGRYIPGTEMGIKTGIISGPYWVDLNKLVMNTPNLYPTTTSVDKCTLHTCAKHGSLIDDMSRTTPNPNPLCLMTCQEQLQTLTPLIDDMSRHIFYTFPGAPLTHWMN